MEVRYAIVGEETVEGEGQYWLELNAALPAGSMILQFLVPGYPFQAESVLGDAERLCERQAGMIVMRRLLTRVPGINSMS